jgi:serine/threonine protein phosphatase PrpC
LVKKLDQHDRFFVLASDGVWDYISPKEVIDRAQSFLPTNNIESCCKRLVNDAADIWNKVAPEYDHQNDESRDDITVLMAFIRVAPA